MMAHRLPYCCSNMLECCVFPLKHPLAFSPLKIYQGSHVLLISALYMT